MYVFSKLELLLRLMVLGLVFVSQSSFALEESPQSFTYEGRVYQSDGTTPLLDTVDFKFEILNNAGTCILYQEAQLAQNLVTSKGVFALNVGSPVGNAQRTAGGSTDSLLTMAQIFQNKSTVSVPVGLCAAGTYTPASGEQRKLRVTITPLSTGVPEVISLNFPVNSVPQALVAETLQGIGPTGFVNIDTPNNLTQVNILNLVNGGDIALARHHHNTENDLRYARLSSASTQNFGSGSVYTAGRVGIGMSSAPTTDLMFGGNSTRAILVDRHSTANTAGNDISLTAGGATTGATDKSGGNLLMSSGIATGTGSSSIQFQTATAQGATNTTDNAPTTKMTILGNGNVGIGTIAPGGKLDISPTVTATSDLKGINSGLVYNGGSAMTNYYGHYIAAPTGTGTITNKYALVSEAGTGNFGFGTIAPLDTLSIGTAPIASATRAQVNFSNTALVGGSGSGTYLGMNPAAFAGNFLDFQIGGASKLKVTSTGQVIAGTSVKVGFDGSACNAGMAGSFRMSGATPQICDGSMWRNLAVSSGAVGVNLVITATGNTTMDTTPGTTPGSYVTFTVSNIGDTTSANISGTLSIIGSQSAQFDMGTGVNNCTTTLAPGAECTLQVRSLISAQGSYSAILKTSANNQGRVIVQGQGTGFSCISANPGNVLTGGPICIGTTEATARGWVMEGGVVVGIDPNDSTKWMVAAQVDEAGSYLWADVANQTVDTSVTNIGTYAQFDPTSGTQIRGILGSASWPANNACAVKSTNGKTDWYLPNKTQLAKTSCHSNRSASFSAIYPQEDPNCVTWGKTATVTGFAVSPYWSASETLVNTIGWHQDFSNGYENTSFKSTSYAVRCLRSF